MRKYKVTDWLFAIAFIGTILAACCGGCLEHVHAQETVLKTNDWFDITITLPSEPDVAGVYLMYRLESAADDDPWTLAGKVDAGPNEFVTVRVSDAVSGVFRCSSIIYDNAGSGNLSDRGLSLKLVEVDKVPPSGAVPDISVPLKGDVNGDGLVNSSDIQAVVNAVLGIA